MIYQACKIKYCFVLNPSLIMSTHTTVTVQFTDSTFSSPIPTPTPKERIRKERKEVHNRYEYA